MTIQQIQQEVMTIEQMQAWLADRGVTMSQVMLRGLCAAAQPMVDAWKIGGVSRGVWVVSRESVERWYHTLRGRGTRCDDERNSRR